MRRVLILTAGYGEGHNSAARALQAAFNEQPDVSAELVDLFALRAPRINHVSRRGYLRLINSAPKVWSRVYRWLDESPRAPWMFRALASHRRMLGRIIAEKQPVALVSTYPVYAWLLNQLRHEGQEFCPHYTVVTDALTINSVWYKTPSAGWFVTDPDSAAFLRARNVPADRVHTSGFPVDLAFADRAPGLAPPEPLPGDAPDKQRAGSSQQRWTGPAQSRRVLFMINTGRTRALETARALLEDPTLHLTITAGRDEGLRRELVELASKASARADVLGWTNRIPELLMSHHVVISKAGGATTQESINALCPMLVSQVVPGQEEGNYELIRRHDAGALAESPAAITAALEKLFADNARQWRQWRGNLRRLAQPNAARTIVTVVLAGCDLTSKPESPLAGMSRNT